MLICEYVTLRAKLPLIQSLTHKAKKVKIEKNEPDKSKTRHIKIKHLHPL